MLQIDFVGGGGCLLPFLVLNRCCKRQNSGPKVIKKIMLISAEHGLLNAHRYKNIKKFSIFQVQVSIECYLSCS